MILGLAFLNTPFYDLICCINIFMLRLSSGFVYSCFEKGCQKKAHVTILKGNLGNDQQGTFLTL